MSAAGARRVVTLGAGRMGRGIAHAFAYAGHRVTLLDSKPREAPALARLRQEALAEVEASLRLVAELGAMPPAAVPAILERVGFAGRDEAVTALAQAEVVFEGVPEVLEAKRAALDFACQHLPPEALIASTTSTFLVDALRDSVAHAERFLNAHWLNPAYIVPLVELSPHDGTSPQALAAMKALLESIGKVPVVCAAAPGFIVPRIQALAMNEAARMVEQGLASPEDIDKATRYGFGFRFAALGLVEFIDYGGNDILYYASKYLAEALGDARYSAPAVVHRLMAEGNTGLKSGQGFYDYRDRDIAAYRRDVTARLLAMLRRLDLLKPPAGLA
jgi:3-hydroxybutyryl-CoA dehydrogenase